MHSEILVEGPSVQEDRKETRPDREVRHPEGQQGSDKAVARVREGQVGIDSTNRHNLGREALSKAHVGGTRSRVSRGSEHRGPDSVSSREQLTLS